MKKANRANLITGCLGLFGGILSLYLAGYLEEHWWLNDWIEIFGEDIRRSEFGKVFGTIILIVGIIDIIIYLVQLSKEENQLSNQVTNNAVFDNNNVTPGSDYSFRMNFDTPKVVGGDQWKCQCGIIHAGYVGTCSCGKTKDEILAVEQSANADAEVITKANDCTGSKVGVSEEVSVKAEAKATTESVIIKSESTDKESALLSKELESANYDLLKKVKDLYDAGVITREEFEAKKKQLLGL